MLWLTCLCQPCSTEGAPRSSHLSHVLQLIFLTHPCLLNPTRLLTKPGWLGSNLTFSSCRIRHCQNFLCCSKTTGSGSFLKSCCIVFCHRNSCGYPCISAPHTLNCSVIILPTSLTFPTCPQAGGNPEDLVDQLCFMLSCVGLGSSSLCQDALGLAHALSCK